MKWSASATTLTPPTQKVRHHKISWSCNLLTYLEPDEWDFFVRVLASAEISFWKMHLTVISAEWSLIMKTNSDLKIKPVGAILQRVKKYEEVDDIKGRLLKHIGIHRSNFHIIDCQLLVELRGLYVVPCLAFRSWPCFLFWASPCC